jgi:hypothetical protein
MIKITQSILNLAIGSKIKFGQYQVETESKQPIIWQIADKNHTGYPDGAVTLITEKIIDLRGFDGKESGNADSNRASNGNNRYRTSNLRQWLNSGGLASSWFMTQNLTDGVANANNHDASPTDGNMSTLTGYDDKDGFLNCFNTQELAHILDTSLTVAKNTVTDGGSSESITDKIFLPSTTEVGLANENSIAEGSKLTLFSDNASRLTYLTQQAFSNTRSSGKPSSVANPWNWWLRTPDSSNSGYVRSADTDGSLSYRSAYYGNLGVRPACNLSSDILVSDIVDVDGCYTIVLTKKYIITLDKPITVSTNDALMKYKFNPKINGNDMNLTEVDNEKLIYKAENVEDNKVDLEIDGKDAKIDKIAYVVS